MLLFRKVYGQFNRDERGILEYSVYDAGSNWLDKFGELIETRFGFTLKYFLDGIDVYYFDYVNQAGVEITMGWDNWTGCFLTTFSPNAASEKYVREIGLLFDALLDVLWDTLAIKESQASL